MIMTWYNSEYVLNSFNENAERLSDTQRECSKAFVLSHSNGVNSRCDGLDMNYQSVYQLTT